MGADVRARLARGPWLWDLLSSSVAPEPGQMALSLAAQPAGASPARTPRLPRGAVLADVRDKAPPAPGAAARLWDLRHDASGREYALNSAASARINCLQKAVSRWQALASCAAYTAQPAAILSDRKPGAVGDRLGSVPEGDVPALRSRAFAAASSAATALSLLGLGSYVCMLCVLQYRL
jgi:hypothetical protein